VLRLVRCVIVEHSRKYSRNSQWKHDSSQMSFHSAILH
jgi:hypothetical protein